jgi:hypothetical protein
MFYILLDTSVWLDLVKDPTLQQLIGVTEQLVQMQSFSLILPRTVMDEFQRNKTRIVETSARSQSSVFKRVKDAVRKFGDPTEKESVLQHLNNERHSGQPHFKGWAWYTENGDNS